MLGFKGLFAVVLSGLGLAAVLMGSSAPAGAAQAGYCPNTGLPVLFEPMRH